MKTLKITFLCVRVLFKEFLSLLTKPEITIKTKYTIHLKSSR